MKLCVQCGNVVETAREVYASPTCYACLPPPEPLPLIPVYSAAVPPGELLAIAGPIAIEPKGSCPCPDCYGRRVFGLDASDCETCDGTGGVTLRPRSCAKIVGLC